jgi:hypothetical protein
MEPRGLKVFSDKRRTAESSDADLIGEHLTKQKYFGEYI